MLGKLTAISSNVWKIRLEFFQSLENAVSLCSLISTPAAFQVPFSPGSARSTRRKPSLQTRSPKPPVNSPRVCAYGANVAAICLIGGQSLPGAFSKRRARHHSGFRFAAVAGVGPSALRGLVFQSPNTIYQSDPLCPSLRQRRPSEAKRACFSVPGQNTGRPLCYGGKRARLPPANARCSGPPRSARYASSGAALAPLFKDHPPDPCARDAHSEDVPRTGGQAPRQQSCHVACLPEYWMRSKHARKRRKGSGALANMFRSFENPGWFYGRRSFIIYPFVFIEKRGTT